MTDDKDTIEETPEEVTMKGLWQHISGMESRLNTRLDAQDGQIADLRSEMSERFDDQDKQLESIRKVTDNELARHADLVRVENKVSDVAADVRELKGRVHDVKGQVSKVQSRLDRGGIPA